MAALDVALTEEDLAAIDAAFPLGAPGGDRYPDMSSVGVVTPSDQLE